MSIKREHKILSYTYIIFSKCFQIDVTEKVCFYTFQDANRYKKMSFIFEEQ